MLFIFIILLLTSIPIGTVSGICILYFVNAPESIYQLKRYTKILLYLAWAIFAIGIYWLQSDNSKDTSDLRAASLFAINLIVALFISGISIPILFTNKENR